MEGVSMDFLLWPFIFPNTISMCPCCPIVHVFPPGSLTSKIGATILGKSLERKEIELPIEKLEKFVGKYKLNDNFQITINLEDEGLQAQATDQPKFPIFPMSETRFFLKVVEAEVEFTVIGGKSLMMTLFQGGQQIVLEKIE